MARARLSRWMPVVCLLFAPLVAATAQDYLTRDEPPAPAVTNLPTGVSAELKEALTAGNDARLEPLLLAEIERHPDSPELLSLLGGVFFRAGKYLNAAIAYKKAEAITPLDDSARFTLAMSYVVMGRRDWAQPEIEKLAAQHPDKALYVYWLGRIDYDEQRFTNAIVKLERAIQLDPQYVRAHDRAALCYEALGRFEQAEQTYRKAVELNRTQPQKTAWPAVNLGTLLYQQDRLEEAAAFLREAVQYEPQFARARYQLGLLFERQDKREEAVAELEQAAKLDPNYAKPLYALGRIYRRFGETQKAVAALKKFEELQKKPKR